MSTQFYAICSVASTRGLKRMPIAIPHLVQNTDHVNVLLTANPSGQNDQKAHQVSSADGYRISP